MLNKTAEAADAGWGTAHLVRASLVQGELREGCPAPAQAGLYLLAARCAHSPRAGGTSALPQGQPGPLPPRPHSPADSLSSSRGAHAAQSRNPRDNYTVIPGSAEPLSGTAASPAAGMNPPGPCLLKIGFLALKKSNLSYLRSGLHTACSLQPTLHTGHAAGGGRRD